MTQMGMELVYGFNDPEDHFVWSTFAFGIKFESTEPQIVLEIHYPHQDGFLLTYNTIAGGRRFTLVHGLNRLALPCHPDDRHYDFQINPVRANPQDMRELGVLVYPLRQNLEAADLATILPGDPDNWTPPRRKALAPLLARYLLQSFIGPGFVASFIQPEIEDGCPFLYIALYLPPAAQDGATIVAPISINRSIHRVTLARDVNVLHTLQPNLHGFRYEGKMILQDFLDAAGALIDLDIFYANPDATERFAHQGTAWRGIGYGPVPSPSNIMRVAGPAGDEFFLYSGATWYVKLRNIYQSLSGKSLESCGPILDWGIGCGRIAKFFPETMHDRLVGVDIDPLNIAWCQEHLPGIQVQLTAPAPPLPFESEAFELIFGHSVMTHLSEASQHEWLAELSRITKPGGYCLLTILGELSWFVRFFPARRTPEKILELLENGFVDDGTLDVGVDADHPGVYRNVSHSSVYIKRVWSAYFEVIQIIPAFADMQNLVVLKRK